MNVGVQIPRHTLDPDTAVCLITAPGTLRQSSNTARQPFIDQVHLYCSMDTYCSMQPAVQGLPDPAVTSPAAAAQCSVWCGPWPSAAQPAGPSKNVSSATKSGDFLPQLSFVTRDQGEYEQAE